MTAILIGGFSKSHLRVLDEVLSQVMGPAASDKVSLIPSKIARRNGMQASNVCKTIRQMVRFGVLRRIEGPWYEFVNDWRAWNWKPRKTGRSGGGR